MNARLRICGAGIYAPAGWPDMARGDLVCSNFVGAGRCHKPATHQYKRARGSWRRVCRECATMILNRASPLDGVKVRQIKPRALIEPTGDDLPPRAA